MIVLDNADKLQGDTTTVSKVDYTIHGVVGTTLTQLADGQLASSKGDLYTSSADSTVIASITLVNTNTSAEVVNLYILPSGGTARRILPQDLSLGIDYSLIFDGNKIEILDDSGRILQSHAGSGRAANYVVAANGAPTHVKAQADRVCDGTNDHSEIQEVIDLLPATGGKVLLTEGTFNIETTITLDSYQTLQGMGRNTILSTSTSQLKLISATGGSGTEKVGITVVDLCVDGNNTADVGVYFEYVDYSIVKNIWTEDFPYDTNREGIKLTTSDYNIITGNICLDGEYAGIALYTSHYNIVVGNYCKGSTNGEGIYLQGSESNTVTGNTCKGNDCGIMLGQSSNGNTITGNTCQGNTTGEGILLYSSCDYNTVVGNTCKENGDHGIQLQTTCDHNNVGQNTCVANSQSTDNTYDGIHLDNSDYNSIQSNVCRAGGETNKPRYGINVSNDTCNSNKIIDNDLYDDGFGTGDYNDSGTGTVYEEPGIMILSGGDSTMSLINTGVLILNAGDST